MTHTDGFPLPGFFRSLAENHKEFADENLEIAIKDVRLMLENKPRTDYFRPTSDPVEVLVTAARQAELCRMVLKMDDESREEA